MDTTNQATNLTLTNKVSSTSGNHLLKEKWSPYTLHIPASIEQPLVESLNESQATMNPIYDMMYQK